MTDPAIAAAAAPSQPAPVALAGAKMAARGVSVRYGDNRALADVDLEIGENRVDRVDRALGVRQVDVSALSQPHERHPFPSAW